MWRYSLARLFKYCHGDFPLHAGKIIEKLIEGLSAFEVVEEVLQRHPSASKNGHAALNVRIDRNDGIAHGAMIRRRSIAVANVLANRRAATGERKENTRAGGPD